jgi:pSer/pThr/pTyr-binding forkhead associated (FHA) protein
MKAPPVILVQLVHISGPMKGEIQEFSENVIAIGRHPSNHLVFPADYTSISRKHAEIIREGNQFRVVDHSANGTFINGKRIQEQYLKDGDVLMFADGGPKVSFLTQVKEDAASLPSTGIAAPKPITPTPQTPGFPQPSPVRREPTGEVFAPPPPVQPPVQKPEVVVQKAAAPLVIQYGPSIRSYKTLPVVLGRHPKCDFVLDHPAILDQHVQIFFNADQYWIKDLTGKGLIKINNRPMDFSAPLTANDDIALSPQGPVFRYLGEGRFAENTEAVLQEPQAPPKERGTIQPIAQDSQPKGFFAKLKKNLTKE